eukprot:5908167-Pyramimonas_sp.AAC.1
MLRFRERLTGGRRVREQVQKALLCLPGDLVWALKRKGPASLLHCAELHAWFSLQASCILAPTDVRGRAFIYQLGLQGCYIGQGLLQRRSSLVSGSVSRWREHARCFYRLRTQRGSVPDSARYGALPSSNR